MDFTAIGALPMCFFFLVIPAILGVALLLINDNLVHKTPVFIVLVVISILCCLISIVFTSSDLVILRFASALVGLGSAFSLFLRYFTSVEEKYSRYMLMVCLIINILYIFF